MGKVFIRDILKHTAGMFGVTVNEIKQSGRTSFEMDNIRFAVCYIAREMTGLSFPQIGAALLRSHSTVMHGRFRCITLMDRDPYYRAKIEAICSMVADQQDPFDAAAVQEATEYLARKAMHAATTSRRKPFVLPDDDMDMISELARREYAKEPA